MIDIAAKFESGLSYSAFLERHGTEEHRRRWAGVHGQVSLSDAQRSLLSSFTREMKVLCLAGAWCGDCVNQCPIFDHFAAATSRIQLRFFDRDAHTDLGTMLGVCGGARVPVVLFASEDNFQVGWYGDRTLSKYRDMIANLTGTSCPTGLVPESTTLLQRVTQDWLNEFERIQWILRTSSRLRQKHGD